MSDGRKRWLTVRRVAFLYAITALFIGVGALGFLTNNPILTVFGGLPALALGTICAILAVIFGTIVVHECGHLLAGYLVGLRTEQFLIGRLGWERKGGRLRYREVEGSWLFGYSLMSSRKGSLSQGQMVFHILGGPAANLIVAALLFVPPGLARSSHSPWLIVALYSLATGVTSLFPYVHDGRLSDGAQIFKIRTRWDAFLRSEALSKIRLAAHELEPPADWNEEDFKAALSDPSDPFSYPGALLFRHYQAALTGRTDQAEGYLDQAARYAPVGNAWFGLVRLAAATFFAAEKHDAVRAEDSLRVVDPVHFANTYRLPMARSVVRHRQGRWKEAIDAAEEAHRLISAPDAVDRAYPQELEHLNRIRHESTVELSTPATS